MNKLKSEFHTFLISILLLFLFYFNYLFHFYFMKGPAGTLTIRGDLREGGKTTNHPQNLMWQTRCQNTRASTKKQETSKRMMKYHVYRRRLSGWAPNALAAKRPRLSKGDKQWRVTKEGSSSVCSQENPFGMAGTKNAVKWRRWRL